MSPLLHGRKAQVGAVGNLFHANATLIGKKRVQHDKAPAREAAQLSAH